MAERTRVVASLAAGAVTALLLVTAGHAESADEESPIERVRVSAERFHFVPSRIKVTPGTRLEIELESRDVEHGFHILDTDIDIRIPPAGGGSVIVIFEADEKGRYRFQCSKLCGGGHASMSGVIVVKGGAKDG